jgi:hypothetical protein
VLAVARAEGAQARAVAVLADVRRTAGGDDVSAEEVRGQFAAPRHRATARVERHERRWLRDCDEHAAVSVRDR